ncbi:unnamed protein product [Prunus brigantina]
MLVDGGSAVNIMPKSTMMKLGITMDELSRSRLMIQGFNQGGQRAMGMIRIKLVIGDLKGGVKKILGDVKPFTEAESYFADAKFYMDEDMVSEVIPLKVHSIGKAMPRREEHSKKWGESDMKFLKESTTIPLPKLNNSDVSKSSVPGFVRPSQEATRHESLPVKRTKEGFDPNAYKLMSKAGYDFGLSPSMGELNPDVTGERKHGLSETQKKLKEQGYTIDSARAGLGFTPVASVKISARRKEKKAEAQHISTNSVEAVEEEEEPKAVKRASVFDRLAKPTQRTSVFSRIKESTSRPSVEKTNNHTNSGNFESAKQK